jgi:primase-polymerase (primpol)-like protein
LAENFFSFVEVFGENIKVVQAGGGVHIVRKCSKLPVTIRRPHFACDLMESRTFGEMGNSIGEKIVGAGGIIEPPNL